eukprot:4926278-Pyramimonas_sp.AAC.1
MVDAQNDRTALWEKRGNDAADEFAKRGAGLHGVEESEYHLWRGLAEAAREVGRWSGRLHALVGDGEACQDHGDSMELYEAGIGRAQASPEAQPGAAPAPAPAAAPVSVPTVQSPAEGSEAYRGMGYLFNGHPMLHATAHARSGHEDGKASDFYGVCGAFFSVERPTRALLRPCLRECAAAGLKRQLAQIKVGKYPSGKEGLKDLSLTPPGGVPHAVRARLAAIFGPADSAPSASAQDVGGGGRRG